MKKRPKPFKGSFVQDWGTYPNETLVCVGLSKKQILQKLRSIKAPEVIITALEKDEDYDEQLTDGTKGSTFCEKGKTILWLSSFQDYWDEYDTLVHELSHLIDQVLHDDRRMCDETEGKAYQIEYLFRHIRGKLLAKVYPKKNESARNRSRRGRKSIA